MAVDKNLFPYDLAVATIFKNEARYLKEWLDYHLLAGVDHFFLYDNESSDDYKKILAPYVAAGLVTNKYFPGKKMQMAAYNDAVQNFRFTCRYIAFIDLDEFIFPKNTTDTISARLDEILSRDENAAGLAIHWQCFGSNGHDKADYSRGVLERFTRRAEKNFAVETEKTSASEPNRGVGNIFFKSVMNPRRIRNINLHFARCFEGNYTIDENGTHAPLAFGISPVAAEKIVINHYFTKSREEFKIKHARGRAYSGGKWPENHFNLYDRNEIFDDGILKYRAVRAEKFSLEDAAKKFSRVTEILTTILADCAGGKIFDLETALTCRAVAHALNLKVHEEASLAAILKSFGELKFFEVQLLRSELPNLLSLPYPAAEEIRRASIKIFSQTAELLRQKNLWKEFSDWNYLCRLLQAWR